jgi:hypothetical protein
VCVPGFGRVYFSKMERWRSAAATSGTVDEDCVLCAEADGRIVNLNGSMFHIAYNKIVLM